MFSKYLSHRDRQSPVSVRFQIRHFMSAVFTVVCVTGRALAVLPLLSGASTWFSESKQADSESTIFLEVAQAVVSLSPYNISQ